MTLRIFYSDFAYVCSRIVRRLLPARLASILQRRHLFLLPGLETCRPDEAARRYCDALSSMGLDIAGKECMIFGYGGRTEIASELIRRGVRFAYLYDKFAVPDLRPLDYGRSRNTRAPLGDGVNARKALPFRVLSEEDVSSVRPEVVMSSSVLEHVDNMEECVDLLARITPPQGIQLHFIDLRDHFFKFPFQMLCYPERVWTRVLNPPTNLNRLRGTRFVQIFGSRFEHVFCQVLERNLAAFRAVKHQIRGEFLTGNDEDDAATQILIVASHRPLPVGRTDVPRP